LIDADDDNLVEIPHGLDGSDDDSHFQSPPQKKGVIVRTKAESERSRSQKRYDHHRKFQTLWVAKLPWTEGIMATDGTLHMIRYYVCFAFERKPYIMAPKVDTLFHYKKTRV